MSDTQGQNPEPTPAEGAAQDAHMHESNVDASAQPSTEAPAGDASPAANVAVAPASDDIVAASAAENAPANPTEVVPPLSDAETAPQQPVAPAAAALPPVPPLPQQAQPKAPVAPVAPAAPATQPAAHVYGAPAYPQPSGPGAPAPHYGAPQHPGAAYAGTPYQGTPLGAPAASGAATGAAFGAAAQAQPETSGAGTTPTSTKTAGGGKAGKVVGLLVAAALVGGAAGLGGAAIGNSLWDNGSSSPAAGPSTVTVNNPENMTATTEIAAKVVPSVVTLDVAGTSQAGSGSGVILSSDGYVLTNTHVVTLDGAESNPTIRVTTSDGHIYTATVVGLDPVYDLAVVKLEGASGLTPIEFADSSKLNVGDRAIAVGAPLGLSSTVTDGIVSALNRSIEIASSALPDTAPATPGKGNATPSPDPSQTPGDGNGQGGSPWFFDIPGQSTPNANSGKISIAVIQTDAAINPGNSGGALVNGKGELIGINVAIATAGGGGSSQSGNIGVGFAIPSNVAERISAELIEAGVATHGLLGATVQPASVEADATIAGAIIRELTAGGPAEKAGLQPGDVVVEFNGSPITSAIDLTAQVRAAAAGSTGKLTYVRGGTSHTVEVTLGQLPG